MGYFSNGSEGMDYEERWCSRCKHDAPEDGRSCPVWEAHLLWNYAECNKPDSVLHKIIPRTKRGNGKCLFFHDRKDGV